MQDDGLHLMWKELKHPRSIKILFLMSLEQHPHRQTDRRTVCSSDWQKTLQPVLHPNNWSVVTSIWPQMFPSRPWSVQEPHLLSALMSLHADPNGSAISGQVTTPAWLASRPGHVRVLLETWQMRWIKIVMEFHSHNTKIEKVAKQI